MHEELTHDDHDRLVARLREPHRYPHPVTQVKPVSTHISSLLLTDDVAYKLKKPLDLGFLDFTTLAQREHACDEELRLNGRLAPAIYLRRVAVTGTPDDPVIEGDGPVIDFAVQMRRFDDSLRFDRLLEAGKLTGADLDAVARQIGPFHQQAAAATPDDGWGTPAAVAAPARNNIASLRDQLGTDARVEALAEWTEAQLRTLEPVFRDRLNQGRVRECHGDLHLGNIVAVDGEPVIFDGIEFAPELRWIDVINEIAFLTMDLRARQRADLAALFLSTYLEITGDYAGAALLPFYRAYRALVRAKINGLQAGDPHAEPGDRTAAAANRDLYLAEAQAETQPPQPRLVLMHGLSGSGKSTVASTLVARLDAVRLRSDVERKRLHGLEADARTGAGVGEGPYDPGSTERTYARLEQLAATLLEAGANAVVDAAALQRHERDRFRVLAQRMGCPFTLVLCQAPEDVLRERIRVRQQAGSDASEADTSVLDHQLATAALPGDDEAADTLTVDTAADPEFSALDALTSA